MFMAALRSIFRNESTSRCGNMKLIAGLGKPGKQYQGTRHNVGFMVIDRLCERYGLTGLKTKFHATTIEGRMRGESVLLMKPVTFMNRSGLAVGEASRFFKLGVENVMIVVDDAALPLGHVRLRKQGSAGSHNGLADIQRSLGTREYARLRIGVGEPRVGERRIALREYVLGVFSDGELAELEAGLDKACDVIEVWLREGVELAMTRFNSKMVDENGNNEASTDEE